VPQAIETPVRCNSPIYSFKGEFGSYSSKLKEIADLNTLEDFQEGVKHYSDKLNEEKCIEILDSSFDEFVKWAVINIHYFFEKRINIFRNAASDALKQYRLSTGNKYCYFDIRIDQIHNISLSVDNSSKLLTIDKGKIIQNNNDHSHFYTVF
jgi:hypothetical protein